MPGPVASLAMLRGIPLTTTSAFLFPLHGKEGASIVFKNSFDKALLILPLSSERIFTGPTLPPGLIANLSLSVTCFSEPTFVESVKTVV